MMSSNIALSPVPSIGWKARCRTSCRRNEPIRFARMEQDPKISIYPERVHKPYYCFQIKPDYLNLQSQSLSRSYGSNLPTSLTYIILSTRDSSPWRPAADIGTAC
uniref:Uncharacterized protein n=1 Tax=Glossina morsitans morsitans TaxID=37546 RepID=A0A1B0F9G6_GLOMM